MRKITVIRKKSFVGMAMKAHVYLSDNTAKKNAINGIPVLEVGHLKNGKSITFEMPEDARYVIVSGNKLTRATGNKKVLIPANDKDYVLSTKAKFGLVSAEFSLKMEEDE